MTNEESILVEQLFPALNMDEKSRNFFLNLLLNSIELKNSKYVYRDSSPKEFDMVFMHLNDEGSIIRFDGAISNGEENKMVYGTVEIRDGKYFVTSNVYRLFELVFGDDKEYRVYDEYEVKDGKTFRTSSYNGIWPKTEEITLKSDEEMEEYLLLKVGRGKGRL